MAKHKRREAPMAEQGAKTVSQDSSPRVHQRDKIDFELKIRQRDDLTDKQKALIELILDKRTKVVFLSGPAGTSKAQPLDAQVLTPNGWTTMGQIKVGDKVMAADGTACEVLSLHPQGEKKIYRVHFSDGATAECCADHLWLTQTCNDRAARKRVSGKPRGTRIATPRVGSVKSLQEIVDTLYRDKTGARPNHYIPLTKAVQFDEKNHVIDPYVMGVLIGDGCLRGGVPRFTTVDDQILAEVKARIPDGLVVNSVGGIDYSIVKHVEGNAANLYSTELRRLGLWNRKSADKFIPDEYLFDSIDNRIELLRGLMDTDGMASSTFTSYSTVSSRLAVNFRHLVNSLGGVSITSQYEAFYTHKGERRQGRDVLVSSVCLESIVPFKLERKRARYTPAVKYTPTRSIVKVELVGIKAAQCILIDHPSHLYLTNDFIVTHNTYTAILAGLMLLNQHSQSDILFIRTVIESASRSLGFLPGEFDSKFEPYLRPMVDKLEEMLPQDQIQRLLKEQRAVGMPVNFLRGASYNARYIVTDEAQNLDKRELTTVITRLGQFSKLIIAGDPAQSDIGERSGFQSFYDLFNDEESRAHGIHCLSFTKEDIVRSGILGYIVGRLETKAAEEPMFSK